MSHFNVKTIRYESHIMSHSHWTVVLSFIDIELILRVWINQCVHMVISSVCGCHRSLDAPGKGYGQCLVLCIVLTSDQTMWQLKWKPIPRWARVMSFIDWIECQTVNKYLCLLFLYIRCIWVSIMQHQNEFISLKSIDCCMNCVCVGSY